MIEGWLRAAEHIAHFALMNGVRVLGFMSIDGDAGVSTISRTVCQALSRSKTPSLFVDLTSPVYETAAATRISADEIVWHRTPAPAHDCAEMIARPTSETRSLFNNVPLLRRTWNDELTSHSVLVVDLPPVFQRHDLVNPLAAAAACDEVFLVCLQGRTRRARLAGAAEILRAARVNVSRVVINQRDHSSPAEGIARMARQFSKVAPRLASRVEKKALNSEFLA